MKRAFLIAVFAAQILFFGFTARHRFIDGDEGFYLLAARLVLAHKKPYLDFFYTQAPLLPYVYALWMKFTQVSWASARLFSALLTALLGTLLCEQVRHLTRSWLAGLAAVVLFASSTLVFAFFPVAKTFSLAELFLFAAYVVVTRFLTLSPRWPVAAGGLLLGLSVDTRSYLLLLAPVFLWWIFRNSEAGVRQAAIRWFLGGFAVGVVPSFYLFMSSPSAFLFNNLGYHAIRSSEGLVGWWGQKLAIAVMTFLGGPEGNGIQYSILFFVTLGFVFSTRLRTYPPRLAFQIALVLGVISLLPTPAYPQYLCLGIPFLVVSTVCVVKDFFATLESGRERLVAAAVGIALFGIYVAAAGNDFRKYLITGDGIPGVRHSGNPDDWRLDRVIEVSQAIDQVAAPGETVGSFWPGYLVQTKTQPFPGFESDYGLPIADKLTSGQRARYHINSLADLESIFAAHTPRVVVLGNQNLFMRQVIGVTARQSLLAHGYIPVRSIGGTSIYVCCTEP